MYCHSLAASGSFQPLLQPVELLSAEHQAWHTSLAQAAPVAEYVQFRAPQAQTEGGFHYRTVEEYHEAYLSGSTTPLEVATRILAFLKSQKEHLNAVTELDAADVLEQATASTERYSRGASLGMLAVVWM